MRAIDRDLPIATVKAYFPAVLRLGGSRELANRFGDFCELFSGHASERMNRRYTHLEERTLRRAVANKSGEPLSTSLPLGADSEQVLITREEDAIQGSRPSQQDVIVHLAVPVLLGCDNRDLAGAKPVRDALRHVDVHVEPEAQADCLRRRRNRCRSGESPVAAAISSTLATLSAICRSNST
jgi:hypothetical protein